LDIGAVYRKEISNPTKQEADIHMNDDTRFREVKYTTTGKGYCMNDLSDRDLIGENVIPKKLVGISYALREKHANGVQKSTGGRPVRR
jgi:hypothetical protein